MATLGFDLLLGNALAHVRVLKPIGLPQRTAPEMWGMAGGFARKEGFFYTFLAK